MSDVRIRNALFSVSDKSNLVEFAKSVTSYDVNILSTGGTFKLLEDNKVPVREVSDYTGYPEMMDGRVKTLHPKIHGGLLGREGQDDSIMASQDISLIDLLVVNLYQFEETVADPNCSLADAIENIDIGGPAMLRSAAKNYERVAVVVDVSDYDSVAQELQENQGVLSGATRFNLAVKAFEHVARYDAAIANYLSARVGEGFPRTITRQFWKVQDMRYGENPHQSAAFYRDIATPVASVTAADQLQGKELSFNNIGDTDAALECVKSFDRPACVIVKHANPCGVAEAETISNAYDLAFACDTTSAFGGIIAFNRPLDEELAREIISRQFAEVIVAPGYAAGALTALTSKKNIRVLDCGEFLPGETDYDFRRVVGGMLVQSQDAELLDQDGMKTATTREPTEAELRDLMFAWKVCKFVKSNASVYAKDQRTIGVGAGQMARVYSAIIAGMKARDENLEVKGSVMASDALFPFRDSIDAAAEAGITAVIQPGGSIRDQEVIDAANEAGMAMIFTGMRHFRH